MNQVLFSSPGRSSWTSRFSSPHVRNPRQSWILDSTPRIPGSRNWIPDFLSVKLGFWIAIVSGILDSLRCIPDSKAQDSTSSTSKKIPGFLNQNSLAWGDFPATEGPLGSRKSPHTCNVNLIINLMFFPLFFFGNKCSSLWQYKSYWKQQGENLH